MIERDITPATDAELERLKGSLELLAGYGIYLRSFDGLLARIAMLEGELKCLLSPKM